MRCNCLSYWTGHLVKRRDHAAPKFIQHILARNASCTFVILPLTEKESPVMFRHLRGHCRPCSLVHLAGGASSGSSTSSIWDLDWVGLLCMEGKTCELGCEVRSSLRSAVTTSLCMTLHGRYWWGRALGRGSLGRSHGSTQSLRQSFHSSHWSHSLTQTKLSVLESLDLLLKGIIE